MTYEANRLRGIDIEKIAERYNSVIANLSDDYNEMLLGVRRELTPLSSLIFDNLQENGLVKKMIFQLTIEDDLTKELEGKELEEQILSQITEEKVLDAIRRFKEAIPASLNTIRDDIERRVLEHLHLM